MNEHNDDHDHDHDHDHGHGHDHGQESDQKAWAQDSGADMGANPADHSGEDAARPRAAAGREMLVQLQQMIDTLATQAGPVMREVAAKAAELAAVAGTKAGPLAHKAAGVTEAVGQRVAARSKDFAAELRRPPEAADETEMPAGPSDEANGEKPSDWSA